MKLLISKLGLLALAGVALTAISVVLFAVGATQWGAAVLALAVIGMFGLILLSHDVRILGGVTSQSKELQEELRAAATVVEFGEQAPEEFLQDLDFWAYFHSDSLTESFGMSTVEAMASGLVVFLPRYMRPNFDDGAVYAEPGQVREKTREYWQDPEQLQTQRRRAREVVMEWYSANAFEERLLALLEHGRSTLQENGAE